MTDTWNDIKILDERTTILLLLLLISISLHLTVVLFLFVAITRSKLISAAYSGRISTVYDAEIGILSSVQTTPLHSTPIENQNRYFFINFSQPTEIG